MKNYYSKPLKFFLISFIICLLYSCTESKTEDASLPQAASDIEILKSSGYDVTGMVEMEEYYLLIPDIIVSKERIKELQKPPQTRMQWEVRYGQLDENHQTIYLKDTGIGEFRDILLQAINEWNKLGNNIFFVFNNNGAITVDITSGFDGDSFNPISIENPSRKGEYGKHVRLNSSKLLPLFRDPEQGKYLMMHVLGHIVGFGHAVTDPFVTPPNGYIIGTTNSDTQSIMRTENDILYKKEKWTGFSKWDKLAIEFVYPYVKGSTTFSVECAPKPTGNDGTTLTLETPYLFTAKYTDSRCPNPAYDIVIVKTDAGISGYKVTKLGDGRFSVTFTRAGKYKVTVKVTNAPTPTQIEKTYTIPEVVQPTFDLECTPQPTGSDSTTVTLETPYLFTAKYTDPRCPNPAYDIVVEKTDTGISGYKVTKLGEGKFSVTFTSAGKYRITVKVTNAPTPTQIERIYTVPEVVQPTFDLECTPQPTGSDSTTLTLETAYLFTAKYTDPHCLNPTYDIVIEKTDAGISGYDIRNIDNGKFSVIFTRAGKYRVTIKVTNAPTPTQIEKTYTIPEITTPIYYLECTPSGTGTNGKTLMLEKKYTFTHKYNSALSPRPTFELIDIFGESPEICEGEDFEILFDLPIQEVARGKFQVIFHTPGKYRIVNMAKNSNNDSIEFEEIYNVL